jgi:phospholipid/cholesterol/gamma-HCH transport system substrate-binding protein
MTTKAQKIRLGIFTVVTAGLLAIVLVVFAGLSFWEKKDTYLVVFDDSVMGLEDGAQVFLAGTKVGRVQSIELSPGDLRRVQVTIEVAHGTPIRKDTKATLTYAGITGLKVIDLAGGSYRAPALEPGGVISQGETTLDKFTKKAEVLADESARIMQRANVIVDNVVAITDPKRFAPMDEIMAQTRTTAQNLAATTGEIHAMVGENRIALRQSIASIRDTAASASEMMDGQVGQLAVNANDFVSELKSLLHENEGPLRSAVFDLKQASRSFKDLAREVRQRPSRLFFSSAPSDRKLP